MSKVRFEVDVDVVFVCFVLSRSSYVVVEKFTWLVSS